MPDARGSASVLEGQAPDDRWTGTSPAIQAKAGLIERAWVWVCRRVGEDGTAVEDLEFGVGWATVMQAVREYGQPPVDDLDRPAGVLGLGVDERAFLRATVVRCTQFVTGVVDLTPGRPARLLDVMPGRSGRVYADWIAEREQSWRDGIAFAALDAYRATPVRHARRPIQAATKRRSWGR